MSSSRHCPRRVRKSLIEKPFKSLKGLVLGQLLRNQLAEASFRVASYLTDPVCKSHEYYRRVAVVEALHPEANKAVNVARKFFLLLGLLGFVAVAALTTVPGIALRYAGASLQQEPYLYHRSVAVEKTLPPQHTFSLLSWNVCCVGAGYAISDGGVLPWDARIERIVERILAQDADVNCLYETFDFRAAFYIQQRLLAHGYAHCYFNIGPRAVGVNSGILVASKYRIHNPEFTTFPVETLVGRTKGATKGVFAFDLQSEGGSFARVFATHLQHSEECMHATPDEQAARAAQMQIIVEKIRAVMGRCVVVTGDLNLDDAEYRASNWQHLFQKGDRYHDPVRTWGGDAFCAALVGKRASTPLNLDHTMMLRDSGRALSTALVDVGYNAHLFTREALSDHAGLRSQITV